MILFILLIGWAFAYAGRFRKWSRNNRTGRIVAWSLGVSLFAQCAMFFAVSITHAQQNKLAFFLVIACLASLEQTRLQGSRMPAPRALEAKVAPKRLYAAGPDRTRGAYKPA